MRHRGMFVIAVLGLLLGLGSSAIAAGGYHQDDRIGYKIRIPKKWEEVALSTNEAWVVAKFMSDKQYVWTDEDSFDYTHKPMLKAIAFIDEVVKKKGVEKTETDEGVTVFEFNNPYKSYKDYLKRTYSGGGWFVSEEEEGEVKGVSVTKMEIKVEKLTRSGPKRIITWIYHLEGVDLAVQIEVLEKVYKKLKGEVYGVLKSFKTVPRTEGSLTPVTTGKKKYVNERKLSPKERMQHRKDREAEHHDKAKGGLPDGWTAKDIGRFLVLNHADAKFGKKLAAQAESVWKWLDKNLPYIGPEEYVPRMVIRICKDTEEESAFRSGGGWWLGSEIVTHKDKNAGAGSWEFEYVNERVFHIWFERRDRELYWALPWWVELGFEQVLGTARAKGSRLNFKPDEWEMTQLREAARAGKLSTPQELMKLTKQDFFNERSRSMESAALIRFFLTGAASKSKKTKHVLENYLKNLKAITSETKEKEKGSTSSKPPETEEEEEEAYRKNRDAWKQKEAELLEAVFERTFGDWKDKDWKTFETLYFKSVG